jgi:hypothetical protein
MKDGPARQHILLEGSSDFVSEAAYDEDTFTLLGPLYRRKHCSFELEECQATGPAKLVGNSSCFALCLGPLVGCLSCCGKGDCFEAMGAFGPWGKCQPCRSTSPPSSL